jgi:dihydrofolate reductase
MKHKDFDLIVALSPSGGIGYLGGTPWPRLLGDLAMFKGTTSTTIDDSKYNAVIMGRSTWESIPKRNRPLAERLNVVVSSSAQRPDDDFEAVVQPTLDAALEYTASLPALERAFVVGGARLYEEALEHPALRYIYITRVHQEFPCDRRVRLGRKLLTDFVLVSRSPTIVERQDPNADRKDGPGKVSYHFELWRASR